jgi:hypothetical protein
MNPMAQRPAEIPGKIKRIIPREVRASPFMEVAWLGLRRITVKLFLTLSFTFTLDSPQTEAKAGACLV